jgi:hypothetical protein
MHLYRPTNILCDSPFKGHITGNFISFHFPTGYCYTIFQKPNSDTLRKMSWYCPFCRGPLGIALFLLDTLRTKQNVPWLCLALLFGQRQKDLQYRRGPGTDARKGLLAYTGPIPLGYSSLQSYIAQRLSNNRVFLEAFQNHNSLRQEGFIPRIGPWPCLIRKNIL